jgi:hypothetical protein
MYAFMVLFNYKRKCHDKYELHVFYIRIHISPAYNITAMLQLLVLQLLGIINPVGILALLSKHNYCHIVKMQLHTSYTNLLQ